MPLVDLDDPVELRARWAALAAVAHAAGRDRVWWADDRGLHYEDPRGNDLRLIIIADGRAVLFGHHDEESRTAAEGAYADLLTGAPDWIGQPEVRHRMATGGLGFVYGHFAGTWARAEYPGDPWQPVDDGFLALGSWLTDDREAEYEIAEQVLSWVPGAQLDIGELRFGAMNLIRAASTSGLDGRVLNDFFALLRGAETRLRPDGGPVDIRAGLHAAILFGGSTAARAQAAAQQPAAPPQPVQQPQPDHGPPPQPQPQSHRQAPQPRSSSPFTGQAPYTGPSPFVGASPFAPQPPQPPAEVEEVDEADEDDYAEPDDDETGFFELFAPDEDDDDEEIEDEAEDEEAAAEYDEASDYEDDFDLEETAEFDPFADEDEEDDRALPVIVDNSGVSADPVQPAHPVGSYGPAADPRLWALPDPADDDQPTDVPEPAEPERPDGGDVGEVVNAADATGAELAVVPDLPDDHDDHDDYDDYDDDADDGDEDDEPDEDAEPSYETLEEAMRAEPERPRPRPEPGPAFKNLHDWCRERTKVVPSGFTIHVYVANPQAIGYSFDLEPPEVANSHIPADRIGSLLHALWQEETDPEHGAWMFARIDAAGRTMRVDRWYDSVPSWWEGPIADRPIAGADVGWHLEHRSGDWQPSYAGRTELAAG